MVVRTCESCGNEYALPLPYEACNPLVRGLCFDCLEVRVRSVREMEEDD